VYLQTDSLLVGEGMWRRRHVRVLACKDSADHARVNIVLFMPARIAAI